MLAAFIQQYTKISGALFVLLVISSVGYNYAYWGSLDVDWTQFMRWEDVVQQSYNKILEAVMLGLLIWSISYIFVNGLANKGCIDCRRVLILCSVCMVVINVILIVALCFRFDFWLIWPLIRIYVLACCLSVALLVSVIFSWLSPNSPLKKSATGAAKA